MSEEPNEYLSRLYDRDALAAFLERTVGPGGDLRIEHHPRGHSNETLFVDWGERELVLRRPPAGETAESAHDVIREHRVMAALEGTDVPVPRMVAACEDHDVVGSDFYLMERLSGDVIRDVEPGRFATPEQRRRLSEAFVDTLAAIHTVDPAAVGLDGLGHPDGYTERQVERWAAQFEWAAEVTEAERAVPELRDVAEWLSANVPPDYDHALVHGDYKLDNVMFAPGTPPEVVAVFDWEMCTRGDPSMDLGWLLADWVESKDPAPEDSWRSGITSREGYPSRRELLDRYESLTGRRFEDERFYRAFGAFKFASAGEMMYRRYLEGNAADPTYAAMGERVPAMAERARRIVDGEEPL